MLVSLASDTLLLPNAGGVPSWMSQEVGESMMIKLPEQFRQHFGNKRTPLDESDGEFMARWAAGDSDDLHSGGRSRIQSAATESDLVAVWKSLTPAAQKALAGDKDRRKAELANPPKAPATGHVETQSDPLVDDCLSLIDSLDSQAGPETVDAILARHSVGRSGIGSLSAASIGLLIEELAKQPVKREREPGEEG